MDNKRHSDEITDENEEHINAAKGHPSYKVTKDLAEQCSCVSWKVELASDKIGYLAKSKQSIEGMT